LRCASPQAADRVGPLGECSGFVGVTQSKMWEQKWGLNPAKIKYVGTRRGIKPSKHVEAELTLKHVEAIIIFAFPMSMFYRNYVQSQSVRCSRRTF